MKYVRTREGKLREFNPERITTALLKAFKAEGYRDGEKARRLSKLVTEKIEDRYGDDGVATVEEIQDIVEETLMNARYHDVARAYILYRDHRRQIRDQAFILASGDMVEDYIDEQDWYVKENANLTKSMQGLNLYLAAKIIGPYWLTRIFQSEARDAHMNGDFHIHDLGILGPYCIGWDLRQILYRGFPSGVRGKLTSGPPKHFFVALLQSMHSLFTLQNEAAGAMAFSNFDTLLAPGIYYDDLDYEGICSVLQSMQGYWYSMGVTTRIGGQSPFTNVTLDVTIPRFMRDEHVIWAGKEQKETYGEFQDELDMFNKAFTEICTEGDYKGRLFSFPIPTYNLTKDFNWDFEGLWKMTAKYGIPYFANFINTDMEPDDVRSMCCRLRIDNRELVKRGGGFFGANPLTGSLGVITINLAKIGYLAKSDEDYFERLSKLMDIAKESLIRKKAAVERFTRAGLYPYTRVFLNPVYRRFDNYWQNHFLTIGTIGMNEACLNYFDESIETQQGLSFAEKTLHFMNDRLTEYQNEDIDDKGYPKHMWNLEATPAESTCHNLALICKRLFPDFIVANEKYLKDGAAPFLTNSTQLPVDSSFPIGARITHQDVLQPLYTGGTVFHNFLNEANPDPWAISKYVKRFVNSSRIPYLTITPTTSKCPNHGYMSGEWFKCPTCGRECEVFSRITGYLQPVDQWNPGKRSEFDIRRTFNQGVTF